MKRLLLRSHGGYAVGANSFYLFWAESGLWDYALAQHLDRLMRGVLVYGVALWSGTTLIEGASTRWVIYLQTSWLSGQWGPRRGHPVLWLYYVGALGLSFVCALAWWSSLGLL